MTDRSSWLFASPKCTKRLAPHTAQTPCQGQIPRYTGRLPAPLRYRGAQPSPPPLPAQPGEPVRSLPGQPARGSAPGTAPSPPPLGASPQAPPETFPGSLRTLSLPAGGKRALAPSVQRARGGGRLPPSCLPPPARRASPRLPHCTAAPSRARGSGCPPAPPAPPAPAGGMSAGEAKEYLARREIPQLFEVGEARGGEAFSAPSGDAPRWDPAAGRAEGGWKDGAGGGCGSRSLRGERLRGAPAASPGQVGAGGAEPGQRCPSPTCRAPAAAPLRRRRGENLGVRRAKERRGMRAGGIVHRSGGRKKPQLFSEVLFSFLQVTCC